MDNGGCTFGEVSLLEDLSGLPMTLQMGCNLRKVYHRQLLICY